MRQPLDTIPKQDDKCWASTRKIAPCQDACPINMDAPRYIWAIGHGRPGEAAAIIRESTVLPLVCGRVCHHPCETACTRGLVEEPIAIRWLKRYASEFEVEHRRAIPKRLKPVRKEKVAVIGSGPAGLTAAYDLQKMGYQTVVYEALPVAGGMLAAGIPEFVLPKDVLKSEIDYIERSGVEIRTGTALGKDVSLDDLARLGFAAVCLATGAHRGRELGIPGNDLEGVYEGVGWLRDVLLKKGVAPGNKVVVIGGGNVAIDAARTARRLGAGEVNILYRRSRDEIPAQAEGLAAAEAEGVKVFYLVQPAGITGENGHVNQIELMRNRLGDLDASGRKKPVLVPGSEFSVEVDTVIAAIGESPDGDFLLREVGVELGEGNTVKADPVGLATSKRGFFAAGDVVSGPASVTGAIAQGHRAAFSISRYLRKEKAADMPCLPGEVLKPAKDSWPSFVERRPREKMPLLAGEKRMSSFKEVELGVKRKAAEEEANRCLNCPMCGVCMFDRAQMCFATGSRLL